MRYLLDTNTLSNIFPRPARNLRDRLAHVETADVGTSVFVAGEMLWGAEKRGSPKLRRRVERVLAQFQIHGVDEDFADRFASLRWHLERKGKKIGLMDTLIAAHALALRATLITDNIRHFRHVPGLRIENWLRPAVTDEGQDNG